MIDVKEAQRISSVSRKAIDEGFERFMNTDILPAIDAVVRNAASKGDTEVLLDSQWLENHLRGLFSLPFTGEAIAARLTILGYSATYSRYTSALVIKWGNK